MSIFSFLQSVEKDTKTKVKKKVDETAKNVGGSIFNFLKGAASGVGNVANTTGNAVGGFMNKDGKFLGRLDDFVPGFKEGTEAINAPGANVADFGKAIGSTGVQNSPIGAADRTMARLIASLTGNDSSTFFGTGVNATQEPVQKSIGEADGLLGKGLTAAGIIGDVIGGAELGSAAKVAGKAAAPAVSKFNQGLGQAGSIRIPGSPEDRIKNMNKVANFKSADATRQSVLSGGSENLRLTDSKALQRAKDYEANKLPADATPDTTVSVYRASEPGKPIGEGDFVSLTESGAKKYTERTPGLQVATEQVPLKDLVYGNGLKNEYVYSPKKLSQEEFNAALTPATPKPTPKVEPISENAKTLLDGINMKAPTQEAVKRGGKAPEEVIKEITDPKAKANILDMFRTPENVLKRMGLGEESRLLRSSYEQYAQDLPKEIDKIGTWHKQLSPKENNNVFKSLDGQEVSLSGKEQKIASEIKSYLGEWADKLNLPEDARISSYITHIFDDGKNVEFDPDVARIIEDKIPGSVYDPFVQKRLGQKGYKEDVIEALDAYVKRAVRKVNMDPALARFEASSSKLEQSQYKYVKNYLDRVNMRPTDVDLMLDNWIKQLPGTSKLGARPTNQITGAVRRMVYRGTLGLNVGSALKNLTQGANTYSQLGEKYTVVGYSKLLKAMASRDSELEDVGVLTSKFVNDRALSAKKKVGEKADKVLFSIFDLAERINRGSAYYGAKSKALKKGMSENEAIESAKAFVRKTQFNFSSVDTPPILSSDIAKTLGQLQSFNVKQAEFLGGMAKGALKGNKQDIAGMVRWTAASLLMVNTVGKALGMSPKDLIPFSGFLTGETKIGETPATKLPIEIGKAVMNAPDKYGKTPENMGERLAPIFKATVPFIPGGSQIKKSVEGISAYNEGESKTAAGNTRFEVEQNPSQLAAAALLGPYGTTGGQEYIQGLKGNKTKKKTGARGSGGRGGKRSGRGQ
jgi:hypothetical protein